MCSQDRQDRLKDYIYGSVSISFMSKRVLGPRVVYKHNIEKKKNYTNKSIRKKKTGNEVTKHDIKPLYKKV